MGFASKVLYWYVGGTMKHRLFTTLSLVILCPLFVFTQSQSPYVFPDKSVEFIATFPATPKIETIFSGGKSAQRAKLSLGDDGFKVEVMEFDANIMANFAAYSEEQLASAGLNHGRDNGLESVTVSTSKTGLGRIAKMQGYKTVYDERMTFVAHFYYGKRQVFVVYIVSPSRLYPSKATTQFLNSVKFADRPKQ